MKKILFSLKSYQYIKNLFLQYLQKDVNAFELIYKLI